MFPNLYILPGKTRESDRVVLASDVLIRNQSGPGSSVEVTFIDGTIAVYPAVIPCLHRSEWTDLSSFEAYAGRKVLVDSPFQRTDRLAIRGSNGYVAFSDGSVFEREYLSRETERLRRLQCIAQIPCLPSADLCGDDDFGDEHPAANLVEAP